MFEHNLGIDSQVTKKEGSDVHLRSVDLNLLTVFDAVMQMHNVTRAAQSLGMSQPAVSNAVARLKVMFNDELFVRYGRGIQPTARARQLFGPVRQALQLVQNELPGAGFEAKSSGRVFNLSICSPLDIRLTAQIIQQVNQLAPGVQLIIRSYLNENIEHQLRYQETEFVIGYTKFERSDFHDISLSLDESVLAVSKDHPRIDNSITQEQLLSELHAVVSLDKVGSFSELYYDSTISSQTIAYESTDMNSVLNIVSQTSLVAIAPRWLVQTYSEALNLKLIPLPWEETCRSCYLTWHESTDRDKGHQWMKELLGQLSIPS
ncbi:MULTISPECIES: transcriptional regulator LeuO [Yersinia]|uniref:Bacterial regulatory helix-turn-helix, lysR family protein n=2 Tax=Yersinia rochesterensis TaxID=1604335 RepID=A0ABN4FLZ2_9GAMM|nr:MULTISPECIES: transcriptional regulator LeuO [Yersinia]AJI88530.1 putative HTH-type transcriptional regulator leuO [Yersinia frederiksenii Y225]CRY62753.1 leucine transcriptional activator [Yersinia kristensenii]AIN20160.1 bacterial regulatory helix-turn-helix, lysR family protein [Yersinia rochesterensis]AJJ36607.1 bacterial regulatory helix-turn-helix, lysR family protein [Yersinia rochesterensis]MDN0105970.1 transcriptional regulator LeuO [Yersinia rochesterensis]